MQLRRNKSESIREESPIPLSLDEVELLNFTIKHVFYSVQVVDGVVPCDLGREPLPAARAGFNAEIVQFPAKLQSMVHKLLPDGWVLNLRPTLSQTTFNTCTNTGRRTKTGHFMQALRSCPSHKVL